MLEDKNVFNTSEHEILLTFEGLVSGHKARRLVHNSDAYFHILISPDHRPFLRFSFQGRAFEYNALPFGLSLLPRTFTKCMNAALIPLRQKGIRVLTYLDDWLVCAPSESLARIHTEASTSVCTGAALEYRKEETGVQSGRAELLAVVGVEHSRDGI